MSREDFKNTPPTPPLQEKEEFFVTPEMIAEAERWEQLTEDSADGIIPIPDSVEGDPNFELGVATDIGYPIEKEKGMEDRVLVRPDLGLYAVFDGVGGGLRGDVAATIAAHRIAQAFEIAERSGVNFFGDDPSVFQAFCDALASDIYKLLLEYSLTRGLLEVSPGVPRIPRTCVAFVLLDPNFQPDGSQKCLIAHMGDCRVSRFDPEHGLSIVTKDHDIFEEKLTELEAQRHPWRRFVERSLGDEQYTFDTQLIMLTPETELFLTSDGIHDVLAETEHDTTLAHPTDDVTLEDLARAPHSAQSLATKAVQFVRRLNISRRAVDRKRAKVDNRVILALKPTTPTL